jgi:ABC-type Fe3+/spermidine/putrescine transport system ATPase subunit
MFQKAYLFPFLNVADNIAFGLKVKGARRSTIRAEVAHMLNLVELPGIERKYPHQLSGGEQQRVALARALVTRPHVLMLDEPLSSLDTSVRHTLQEVIRRIQRETGVTALLVTHDLSEAVAMSDRTTLLLDGTIAACAAPRTLFQRPPSREVARFVGISTFLEGDLERAQLCTHLGSFAVNPTTEEKRPATFAIRPEHLRLCAAPGINAIPGVVADLLYKGEFTEYQVAVNGGIVRVRDYQPQRSYAGGDPVHVQFPPEHLFEVE